MENGPDARALLMLAQAGKEAYEKNPTDLNEILKAVEGAEKLMGFADRTSPFQSTR